MTYPGFGCVFFFGRNRMVHFVGAGPGAADLITLRGAALLETADQVIYAGSLVNPALLETVPGGLPDPEQRRDDPGRGN